MTIRSILAACAAILLTIAASPATAASQRHVILVSDLHVGAGKLADGRWNPIEDFRWQPEFNAFLNHIAATGGNAVDLVLVGDVFELWQSPTMTCSSDIASAGCVVPDCHEDDTNIGCSEAEAVARLDHVLRQHADFVAALDRFASAGANAVHIIPGNHDAALLFPAVRQRLLSSFKAPSVKLLERGYFLSDDGLVYADHGHQFDEVNRFDQWPRPFETRDGIDYMRKPWGENMVQQFYNQYEGIFPVIDNLAEEKSGVEFAVKEAGLGQSAAAVGKFLRFFVFQQSLRQARDALGADGKPDWDYKTIRGHGIEFFIEALARDSALQGKAKEAERRGLANFNAAKLTNDEIDMICLGKDNLPGVVKCERLSSNLSAAAQGVLFTDDDRRQDYLRAVLPRVARGDFNLPKVYVLGHTHKAAEPANLTITGLKQGEHEITYANTGAFQRVASEAQVHRILAATPGRTLSSLVPEDLPACYNYISIAPYDTTPALRLLQWSTTAPANSWMSKPGSCLAMR